MSPSPKPSISKLQQLQKQRDQIQARIDRQRALLKSQERKADTRRKIIAGALALEHAEINSSFGAQLHKLLNEYVTRPDDRALFNLPPLPIDPAPSP
jgi:hypothetical protein